MLGYLGNNQLNDDLQNTSDNCELIHGLYRFYIFSEDDISWIIEWYKLFFENIGWKLMDELSTDEGFYDFFCSSFSDFVKFKREFVSLEYWEQVKIDRFNVPHSRNGLITAVYLGLKNGYEGVDELMDLTLDYWQGGKLYKERFDVFKAHFGE